MELTKTASTQFDKINYLMHVKNPVITNAPQGLVNVYLSNLM